MLTHCNSCSITWSCETASVNEVSSYLHIQIKPFAIEINDRIHFHFWMAAVSGVKLWSTQVFVEQPTRALCLYWLNAQLCNGFKHQARSGRYEGQAHGVLYVVNRQNKLWTQKAMSPKSRLLTSLSLNHPSHSSLPASLIGNWYSKLQKCKLTFPGLLVIEWTISTEIHTKLRTHKHLIEENLNLFKGIQWVTQSMSRAGKVWPF